VLLAQENAPAADIDPPCYLAGQEQRDYPRPNGYRNRRYLADQVRASLRNFSSERYGPRTQNYRIGLIEYVLPRQIFCRAEIMVKHRTLIQGIKVLRNMSEEKMFKIIIIAIIVIHLLLNL